MVLMIKNNVDDVVTLAIGDGGNDCSMIQAANVGVGISGNEGMQAANCSDFTITQFAYLRHLILYHGALSYRRLCNATYYSYYKNIIISLITAFYSIFNMFSATTVFPVLAITLFNMVLTSLPPFAFGLLDQPVSATAFVNIPRLYAASQKGYIFSIKKLILWISVGSIHSAMLYFLVHKSLSMGVINSTGFPISRGIFGVILVTLVILLVNLKASIEMTSWTWLTHVIIWAGLVFWILIMSICSRIPLAIRTDGMLADVDKILYKTPLMWCMLPIVFIVLIPDFLFKTIRDTLFTPAYTTVAGLEKSINNNGSWDPKLHCTNIIKKLNAMDARKSKYLRRYCN